MSEKYEILNQIRKDNGILEAEILSDEMKKRILEIEMERLKELIPVINEGINKAFKEEQVAVIIQDRTENNKTNNMTPMPTLTLLTESGKLVGEEIYDEEELEELHQRNDVYFLSDNFVTYTNLGGQEGEKQFFKVSDVDCSLFTNQNLKEYANSVTVAVPSTNTDHYIKEQFGHSPEDQIGTMIVGFTL